MLRRDLIIERLKSLVGFAFALLRIPPRVRGHHDRVMSAPRARPLSHMLLVRDESPRSCSIRTASSAIVRNPFA